LGGYGRGYGKWLSAKLMEDKPSGIGVETKLQITPASKVIRNSPLSVAA
jgi:hypothetical protein